MNICQCGATASYPHDPFCPYPLYKCTDLQWQTWEHAYQAKKSAWERKHPQPKKDDSAPDVTNDTLRA